MKGLYQQLHDKQRACEMMRAEIATLNGKPSAQHYLKVDLEDQERSIKRMRELIIRCEEALEHAAKAAASVFGFPEVGGMEAFRKFTEGEMWLQRQLGDKPQEQA